MKEKYLKIIAGSSVITVVFVSLFYFQNNNTYMFIVSVAGNTIQILMFIIWFFRENPIPPRTITQIDEIHRITKEEEKKYKRKEEIVTRLIREGVIADYDIKKIFQSLRKREVFLIHTYGEGVPQKLLKSYGGETQPLITILLKIGFVRIFKQHNLFIIFKKNLPKNLRSLNRLEKFLQQEIEKVWIKIEEYTKRKYPSSKYKIYDKWRNKEGFKCSYILFKTAEEDFMIGYKGKQSFTPQFISSIVREIEISEIKPITNKVKLRQFVAKTSIEILMEGLPKNIKKEILKHEKSLKNNLKIGNFTDFKDVSVEQLTDQLNQLAGIKSEEGTLYSGEIKSRAQEFYNILIKLGMSDK